VPPHRRLPGHRPGQQSLFAGLPAGVDDEPDATEVVEGAETSSPVGDRCDPATGNLSPELRDLIDSGATTIEAPGTSFFSSLAFPRTAVPEGRRPVPPRRVVTDPVPVGDRDARLARRAACFDDRAAGVKLVMHIGDDQISAARHCPLMNSVLAADQVVASSRTFRTSCGSAKRSSAPSRSSDRLLLGTFALARYSCCRWPHRR
jgi:hypothetical protein